mgnify:CR=1 FL=1
MSNEIEPVIFDEAIDDIINLELWGSVASHLMAFFEMTKEALKSSRINCGFFSFSEMSERYHQIEKEYEGKKKPLKDESIIHMWLDLAPAVVGIIRGAGDEKWSKFGIVMKLGRDTTGLGDHIEHTAYAYMERDNKGGFKYEFGYDDCPYPYTKTKRTPFPYLLNELEEQFKKLQQKVNERDNEDWERASEEVEKMHAKETQGKLEKEE